MAENGGNDVCNYIGKSNSSSVINSPKQIDLVKSNHHHQHHHQQHHQQQQLDDVEHINNAISITSDVSTSFPTHFISLIQHFIISDKMMRRRYFIVFNVSLSFFEVFATITWKKKKKKKSYRCKV